VSYLQVDFGRPEPVAQFFLTVGRASATSAGLSVTESMTASVTGAGPCTAAGNGQITAITWTAAPCGTSGVTLTASVGNWWSVADVRAYASNRGPGCEEKVRLAGPARAVIPTGGAHSIREGAPP